MIFKVPSNPNHPMILYYISFLLPFTLSTVLGLGGKVLVVRVVSEVASVRRCQKLPPCQMEPVPAGSKTDTLLAKAEPLSDGGSASVMTYLRKGENCCTRAAGREK